MVKEILIDIGTAVGWFFVNPLFIISLLVAVCVGYFRVKKERASFRVRMLPGFTELQSVLSASWIHAMILSLVISGVGLVVKPEFLLVFSVVALLFILTCNFKIASPIYMTVVTLGILWLLDKVAPKFSVWKFTFDSFTVFETTVLTITMITGLLLIVEGSLIAKNGHRGVSSYLIRTKRGLKAGVFKAKRLWLLPTVFLVPGDMIQSFAPYWPQITLGETTFSFVLFPVVIGFSQVIRTTYPDELLPQVGRAVMVIGFVVAVAGVAGLWMPVVAWGGLAAGFVARIVLSIVTSVKEKKTKYILAPRSQGVTIAGIVPDSPGMKIGLVPGEIIRSVNGQPVHSEKDLYDAIQINAAHCRLQIIDRNGEVRLLQQVLYHHDHHRLGILVVR